LFTLEPFLIVAQVVVTLREPAPSDLLLDIRQLILNFSITSLP